MFYRLHDAIKSSKCVNFICVPDLSLLQRAPEDLDGFIVGFQRNRERVRIFTFREQRNNGQGLRIVWVHHELLPPPVPAIAELGAVL